MTIHADVHRAKAEYDDHLAAHKCRYALAMIADGLEPCEKRTELLQAWFGTAGLLGKEPDDKQRQRDHHFRNVKNAPPSSEAELVA